jgi:hypothetical protein
LQVNLIIVKLWYTLLIERDCNMICEEKSIENGYVVACNVKNMTVVEDLA